VEEKRKSLKLQSSSDPFQLPGLVESIDLIQPTMSNRDPLKRSTSTLVSSSVLTSHRSLQKSSSVGREDRPATEAVAGL
jgi:hypothetical protein